MPLQRFRYTAWLNLTADEGADPTELSVEVTTGDRLRAELEAGKQNLPVDPRQAPQQTTVLWLWCALVRLRTVEVDYRTFRDGNAETGQPAVLVHFEQDRDPDSGDPATSEVPPTMAPSDSPSPSLATSATSDGGSTPTPMSD